MTSSALGSLAGVAVPVLDRLDLVAAPVAAALQAWPGASEVVVAEIDPDLADTAAFCDRYGVAMAASANCVVVTGRRGEVERTAACMVLATTRADVNGFVRRRLDVRKASFASMDFAVGATGMEYGGITPVGLPNDWPVLVDQRVAETDAVVIGSGLRRSKLALPGPLLVELPSAELHEGLARELG